MMKSIFLFASIILASGLFLTNVYNSIVDATSWGSDIPASVEVAREYFKHVNPGNFFRVFSPVSQILALLVLILFWKTSSSIRLVLGIAFVIYVLTDVMTFTYFYPRNDILFKTAQLTDVETIRRVWSEWNTMNWIRSFIIAIGITFSSLGLHKFYTLKQVS